MSEAPQDCDERRLDFRLNRDARLYVEVVSSLPGEQEGAEVVPCEVLDLSASGVQVAMAQPLVVGSILPLYVEVDDSERYCLTGEVRWVKPGDRADWFVIGFQLYESEQTSIIEWKRFIARSI